MMIRAAYEKGATGGAHDRRRQRIRLLRHRLLCHLLPSLLMLLATSWATLQVSRQIEQIRPVDSTVALAEH